MQSVQGRRQQTPNDSEDHGAEGAKHIKGLGRLSRCFLNWRGDLIQQGSVAICDYGIYMPGGSPANGRIGYFTSLKRK